jgi:hypothetical protein
VTLLKFLTLDIRNVNSIWEISRIDVPDYDLWWQRICIAGDFLLTPGYGDSLLFSISKGIPEQGGILKSPPRCNTIALMKGRLYASSPIDKGGVFLLGE